MKVKVIKSIDKSKFEDELEVLYNDPNIDVVQLDTHTESFEVSNSFAIYYIAIVVYYTKDKIILPTVEEETNESTEINMVDESSD